LPFLPPILIIIIDYSYIITYFNYDVKRIITLFNDFFTFFIAIITDICYIDRKESKMGMTERIRILLVKRGNLSEAELARRLGILPQNFNVKMKRDNFTEKDLQRIAEVLNCDFEAGFVLKDTGERI
jgi:hypothetical protein